MGNLQLSEIASYNEAIVKRYIDLEKRGVGKSRRKKITLTLNKLGRLHLNKRLDQVSKDELQEFVDSLKDDTYDDPDYPDGYEVSTKITYLKITKPFFKWLHAQDDQTFSSWIKAGNYTVPVGPDASHSD